jgi:acetolactate synthase-1/2/3 large subunit
MTGMNGAESLVRTLVDCGIDHVFTNPGSTEMEIIREFDAVPELRPILGLFEGVCTGAADGYARMTGKPAASLLHVGPGLANGLSNLHNAKRAFSPLVNIVGTYPSYHRRHDPLLDCDLESLAKPMSNWVRVAEHPATLARDGADAVAAARRGQIATLIVPQDATWGDDAVPVEPTETDTARPRPTSETIEAIAGVLAEDATAIIVLNGTGLSEKGLAAANRIAAKTGCRLMVEVFLSRMARGGGRGKFGPLPGDQPVALETLGSAKNVILAGTKPPVAYLAYEGYPSLLIPEGTAAHELAGPTGDAEWALEALAEALDATTAGAAHDLAPPERPSGPLNPKTIGMALGALLPENAIIVSEATTSGGPIFGGTRTAQPHDWLGITGGSIGMGLPVAIGAAVACPNRKVVCIQADGGGMYTNQALWTHAREALDITTVILTNRRYKILENEYFKTGANELGPKADRLFDIGNPDIDWTHLAKGMGVEGNRAETAEDFTSQLDRALAADGPQLIDAVFAS